jgi:hypothetical protein
LGAFRDGETCIESIVVFKGWIASCVGVSMVLSMASRRFVCDFDVETIQDFSVAAVEVRPA